ncbi:MAG: hypothetical protein FWE95_02835 [Planctomycetaceae bacterium]|nr:hypothetical protein [Planctomycetaceae bacterium]
MAESIFGGIVHAFTAPHGNLADIRRQLDEAQRELNNLKMRLANLSAISNTASNDTPLLHPALTRA